jgi:hypothetical protein
MDEGARVDACSYSWNAAMVDGQRRIVSHTFSAGPIVIDGHRCRRERIGGELRPWPASAPTVTLAVSPNPPIQSGGHYRDGDARRAWDRKYTWTFGDGTG